MTRPAARAIRDHGVGHVVGVSSAGSGWPQPAGMLDAAFAMDAELESSGAAYRALAMPAYMDNVLSQVDAIRDEGTLALPFRPDLVLPLVATRDIAAVAASLLSDRSWSGKERRLVFGPDHLTPVGMAEVISEVVGRTVTFTERDPAAIEAAMVQHGASPGVARDMLDMFVAQNGGIYQADHAAAVPTPTDFRTWCEEVLLPAIRR